MYVIDLMQIETCTMYKRKVDVDMLNAVKSVLADVSSVSPSSELYVLPPRRRRRRPKLVLTGTSIPLYKRQM